MKMPSAFARLARIAGSLADSRSWNTKVSTEATSPTSSWNSSPISPPIDARSTTTWPLPALARNQRRASWLRSPPPISSRPGDVTPGVGNEGSPARWRSYPEAKAGQARDRHASIAATMHRRIRVPIARVLRRGARDGASLLKTNERSASLPGPFLRGARSGTLAAMATELDAWFVREILVHEEALMRYLSRCWPRRDEVHDLRQETYVRVYQAAARALPLQPKAFLFTSARNLMADHLRRARVVSIEPMGDLEPWHVLMDDLSPERWCGGRQVLH